MNIHKATRKYERWLATFCRPIASDLRQKHLLMRADAFSFLRGTFYRWAQRWPRVCPALAGAPNVRAVGDLHVENFGTWRDVEGRLVWGINDFDECARLPYTNDLVRLATSALLAIGEARLHLTSRVACTAILEGYRRSLAGGGEPFVLDLHHHWLRHAATAARHPPATFWRALAKPTSRTRKLPGSARKALRAVSPGLRQAVFHPRVAGVGSLGRPRIVGLAISYGNPIAREAKAVIPSAVAWATDARIRPGETTETIQRAVRSHDPFYAFGRKWVIRRLAPDCRRVELADLPRDRDERRLLDAMGAETANVHLGDPEACRRILRDLEHRPHGWLVRGAEAMTAAVVEDWRHFRRG